MTSPKCRRSSATPAAALRYKTNDLSVSTLFYICGENVELVTLLCVAIRAKYQLLAIWRVFGERGEAAEVGHLLESAPIEIDLEQLEFPAIAIVFVRGKQDPFPIG